MVQSSIGRTTPCHCPVNRPRAESPSAGSWTWKATARAPARPAVTASGRRAERDRHVDGCEPLVEVVARNPRGRHVLAGRRRIEPARARIHRIERDVPRESYTLIFGKIGSPGAGLGGSRCPPARARRLRRVPRRPGRLAPTGAGRARCRVRERGRATPCESRLRSPTAGTRPPLGGVAFAFDPALVEPDRAVAELRDRLHVVRDEQTVRPD